MVVDEEAEEAASMLEVEVGTMAAAVVEMEVGVGEDEAEVEDAVAGDPEQPSVERLGVAPALRGPESK